jgi:putative peptide modification system cyclase
MSEDHNAVEPGPARAAASSSPRVRTLLACDLVDSTALVERLGDAAAAELFRRHDRLARDLMQRHGGREIDKTDGYLVLFERPVEAVAFALSYQRALREFDPVGPSPLRARVGIHVGEVVLWENSAADVAAGAKSVDIEGLAKPVVARLMSLALPGQIVMSGVAFTIAQRAEKELDPAADLRWLTHGRYRFKGVPAPMLVHEVGEAGHAPLQAPPSSSKAQRDVPLWRRPGVLAIEGLALFAAIAIPIVLSLRATPAIAFGERDWVVLGDVRNLTSEPLLSGALDSALRIGLEQSRYVNVVPNLQVQEALRRMERPGTALDRDTGVQLAAREGARALLLPSLTEVGRDLRFSIEVVDPASGNTVLVETADAASADAVLPAIDQALSSLRSNLGESIKDIEQAGAPLADITTGSLDALRAYGQVDPALSEGKVDEAITLLELALRLDPGFAMAEARLGFLEATVRRMPEEGLARLERALADPARLSLRERLLIETARSERLSAPDHYEQTALLARLYPDLAAARHNLGITELFWRLDPARAAPQFEFVGNSSHPRRGESWIGWGLAQMQLGKMEAAAQAFERAEPIGGHWPIGQEYLILLGLGRHEEVARALATLQHRPAQTRQPETELIGAALEVDQGQPEKALARVEDALARLAGEAPSASKSRLALASLSIAAASGELTRARIDAFVASEVARLGRASQLEGHSAELHLAYALILASRHGIEFEADELLERIDGLTRSAGPLAPAAAIRVARCMRLESARRAPCLVEVPAPRLYVADVATWDALRAAGDAEGAARWQAIVAAGRGRAITELETLDLLVGNLLDAARARAAPLPD